MLEIGTGSGYQGSHSGKMAGTVHTMERHMELAACACQVLDELEIHNVHIHLGDGSTGWAEAAPYHAIAVTAAAPRVPPALLEQLAPNGRLVIPVGSRFSPNITGLDPLCRTGFYTRILFPWYLCPSWERTAGPVMTPAEWTGDV